MSKNSSDLFNSTINSAFLKCYYSLDSVSLYNAYIVTRICLRLPLSIFVLYLVYRQRRQQRSLKTMSHSDMFTFHNAMLELISGLGIVFFLSLIFSGETSFHLLTCVECYLAVVHPLTYLRLRNAQGIKIRNISIGCAWLLCLAWSTVATLDFPSFPSIHIFCLLFVSIVIVSFCSLSVLCILIRPGPGGGGGDRDKIDQLKHRAFLTIMAITGVLWLWFIGYLVFFALGLSPQLCESDCWMMRISGFWFSLPSSLVLLLLYLHRTGKLSCCCCKNG